MERLCSSFGPDLRHSVSHARSEANQSMASRDWAVRHIHECIAGSPCRCRPNRNLGLHAITPRAHSLSLMRSLEKEYGSLPVTGPQQFLCGGAINSFAALVLANSRAARFVNTTSLPAKTATTISSCDSESCDSQVLKDRGSRLNHARGGVYLVTAR